MLPVLQGVRDQFLSFYPDHVRPDVEAALPELEIQAARLGMEVLHAERSGVSFAEAVRRPGDWPLMARVHFGILDFLQFELPRDLAKVVRVVFGRVQAWDGLEDLRRLAVCHAALHRGRADSALARFALYEAIRLNLWLLSWDEPAAESLGCMTQLDRDAEAVLRDRLVQDEMFDEEVRPLHVLVADAASRLQVRFEEARAALAAETPEIIEFVTETLCRATAEARCLNAADAATLRNEYAGCVGDVPLESLLLSERHPQVLPSAEAVDMRRSRLRKKLGRGGRVRTRVIDVLRSAALTEVAP
jgi:hypothetical protein